MVTRRVPKVNVGAFVQVGNKGASKGATIALKQENTLIQVIAIVDGNKSVDRLGAPDLGWNVDDKLMS